MIRLIREIAETVRMANQVAAQSGDEPRWTLFLTNRSFIAQLVALIFALAGMFGLFIPIGAEDVLEIVALVGFLAAQGWALIERLKGSSRVIWTRRQAEDARKEADALSQALRNIGAM